MKVIDLLNKIANGEVIGENKIKIDNNVITIDTLLGSYIFDKKRLNDEVEIIEEDKKIEKLEILSDNEHYSNAVLYGKINEIIDYINGSDKE